MAENGPTRMGHQMSRGLLQHGAIAAHCNTETHLLRLIEKHISFAFVREKAEDSYSETGRASTNGGIGWTPFERTELSCNFLHVISYANLDNRRYRDQNPGTLRRCIFLSAKVPSLLHSPEERRHRERGSLSHCRVPPTSSRE